MTKTIWRRTLEQLSWSPVEWRSGRQEQRQVSRVRTRKYLNWKNIIITRTIINRQELIMSFRDRPPLIAGSLPFLTQIRNQVKDLFFQFNFRHALHDNKISGRISPGKLTSGDEKYLNQNYFYLGECSNLLTCACLMIVFINTSPDQSYCCVWSKLFISDNEWQWGVVTCWTLVTLLRPETWDPSVQLWHTDTHHLTINSDESCSQIKH